MKGKCTEEKATKQLIQIGFERQKEHQTPFHLSFSSHKFQKLNNFTSMHSYRELKQHTDIPITQQKPQQRINSMRVEKKAKMYQLPCRKLNPLANLGIQGAREQKQCPISSRRQQIIDRRRKKTRNFSYQFHNAINQNKKSKEMITESKQQLQAVNLSLPKIDNLVKPTERKALLLSNIISKRITKNE